MASRHTYPLLVPRSSHQGPGQYILVGPKRSKQGSDPHFQASFRQTWLL